MPSARFSAAVTASSTVPPASATSAAASAQKPSAMATMPVSTTRTGTGARAPRPPPRHMYRKLGGEVERDDPAAPDSAALR